MSALWLIVNGSQTAKGAAWDPDNQLHYCTLLHIAEQTTIHQLFQVARPRVPVDLNVSSRRINELHRNLCFKNYFLAITLACFVWAGKVRHLMVVVCLEAGIIVQVRPFRLYHLRMVDSSASICCRFEASPADQGVRAKARCFSCSH